MGAARRRIEVLSLRLSTNMTASPMSEQPSVDFDLIVLQGEELRTFELPARAEVTLGRDESNQVCIDHPSVSRRHALLRMGSPIVIEDLGGANGTFVRERTRSDVTGKTEKLRRLMREKAELAVGESVLLGAVSIVVRRRPEAAAGVIIQDANMRALYAQADRAAAAFISVLLLGETGVGKEVLARAIHIRSPRAKGPFLAINCASFSENLLEGELFGYEKGAFTGAVQARPGLFEAASGGTIFLDEVGELPLATQVKLLRVLEERAVLRIGARSTRPVDARFLAATNRDIEAEVRAGRFRQDLFYRLNGISLTIPPLRERPSEIEPLVHSFVAASCRQLERSPLAVAEETMRLLHAHTWPGNVRELRNVMERAVVLCAESTIRPEYLPPSLTSARIAPVEPPRAPTLPSAATRPAPAPAEVDPVRHHAQLESLERARIVEALDRCSGNQTQAAKLLGMSRRTLVARLTELDLPRPRKRGDDSQG
jgi:two-component system, NtrC family, response regulator AtoC